MAGKSNDKEIEVKPSTDVQVEEQRQGGREQDVNVPKLQARAVSRAFAFAVLSLLWLIIAIGPVIFHAVVAIVGLASFVWLMRQAAKWEVTDEETGETYPALQPADVIAYFLLIGLFGLVAWSTWRVAQFIAPPFAWPGWVPVGVVRWMRAAWALAALALFTYCVWNYWHLELAMVQELTYRSPFMEKYLFEAIGHLVEFFGKKPRPKPRRTLVYSRNGRPPSGNGAGGGNGRTPGGNGREVAQAVFEEVRANDDTADVLAMMEFLVRGQQIAGDDGKPVKYSRRKWDGITLPWSNVVVTAHQARKWGEYLGKVGLLEDHGSGLDLAPNLSLWDALEHLSLDLEVSPPPQALREWGRGVANSQPSPAPPTPPAVQEVPDGS